MKRFLVLGMTSLLFSFAPHSSMAETRWDMPSPGEENRAQTRILQEFVTDIGNRSSSTLNITLHPDETLIRQNDTINALKSNVVSLAAVNANTVLRTMGVDPNLLGLSFQSYDNARAFYKAAKPAMSAALAKDNLVLLAPVPHMGVGILTPRPLNSINELRRQNFSSTETGLAGLAKLLDSELSPEPKLDIEAGKFNFLFSDAASSRPYALPGKGIGFYYNIHILVPFDLVVIRKNALDGLPENERRALLDGAKELENNGWEAIKSEENAALGLLKQNDVAIVPANSGVGSDFKALRDSIVAEHKALWQEKGLAWPPEEPAAQPEQ